MPLPLMVATTTMRSGTRGVCVHYIVHVCMYTAHCQWLYHCGTGRSWHASGASPTPRAPQGRPWGALLALAVARRRRHQWASGTANGTAWGSLSATVHCHCQCAVYTACLRVRACLRACARAREVCSKFVMNNMRVHVSSSKVACATVPTPWHCNCTNCNVLHSHAARPAHWTDLSPPHPHPLAAAAVQKLVQAPPAVALWHHRTTT